MTYSKMEYSVISDKLRYGQAISDKERNFLLQQIEVHTRGKDFYSLVRAFSLAFPANKNYINIVEEYLKDDKISDVDLSGVISALCQRNFWGLAESYLHKLLVLTDFKNLDEYPATQIVAFIAIGEYLEVSKDQSLYQELMLRFEKYLLIYQQNKKESNIMKSWLEQLYHTLDRGIRGRTALLEHRVGRMEFPDDVNQDVIAAVKRIISLR